MRAIAVPLMILLTMPCTWAGINKLIQQEYRQRYENQTVFLSVPLYGSRQRVSVRDGSFRLEPESEPLRFKVGEQVRVLDISFGGEEIRFKLGAVDTTRQGELEFRFPAPLDDGFSARKDFDAALRQVFSEGLNYSEIDKSKKEFIRRQLDTVVGEFMSNTSADREFVLDALADSLPAYRQAVEEKRSLQEKNQDLSLKLSTEQSKSRQLENKVVEQTSEINRLKSMTQSLKTDYEAISSSSSNINKELLQLKQQNSEIVASVKRLQRGLGIELDAGKPLSKQVEDLMVAALKTKGERDNLEGRLKTSEGELEKTRQELQAQLKSNTQLQKENAQLQENVKLLSSRGDQLGQRYLALQREKNQLENFVWAIEKLKAQTVRETRAGDRSLRVMELRLNDALVGTLETDYPMVLKPGVKTELKTKFSAESINYIKLSEQEKKILSSLGEKLAVRNELRDLPEGMTAVLTSPKPQLSTPKAQGTGLSDATQVVAERGSAEWSWQLDSSRVMDANLVLLTSFVNQNKDAVPLVHNRLRIESRNLARQLGYYLEPIPLALGTLFGFVLLGIVNVLRRSSARRSRPHASGSKPTHDRIEL